MDDRRLDVLEDTLLRHARARRPLAAPENFTAGVMREVRAVAARRSDFWMAFACAARRFAPAGALAATAACGYALMSELVLDQALLTLSLHGSGSTYLLAGLLP